MARFRRRSRRLIRSASTVILAPARRARSGARRLRRRFARRRAARSFSIPLLSWAIALMVFARLIAKLGESEAMAEFRRGYIRGFVQRGEERDLRGMFQAWGLGLEQIGRAFVATLPWAIGGGVAIALCRRYLRGFSTTVRLGPVALRTLS